MAITPYTTAAKQTFIPMKDYTPVEIITGVMDKFDARQAEGLAAADKLDLLRQQLAQKVLPEQQAFADEALKRANDEMATLAESGDYIDAMPKLRRLANQMNQDFQNLNANYSLVQDRREQIEKIMADNPEALTPDDVSYFLNEPRAALASGRDAKFNAPVLTTRVDRRKILQDFYDKLTPDTLVDVRTEGGRIIKKQLKELSPEKIVEAGKLLLESNAAIRAEQQRDFERTRGRMGEDPEAEYAWSQYERIQDEKVKVDADTSLTADQKAQRKAELDEEYATIEKNAESFMRRNFIEGDMRRTISPFLSMAFRDQSGSNITTDQAYWNHQDAVAARAKQLREARDEQNLAGQLIPTSGMFSDFSVIAGGGTNTGSARATLSNQRAMVDEQISQLDPNSPQYRLAVLDRDKLDWDMGRLNVLDDEAQARAGITDEQMARVDALRAEQPTRPPGVAEDIVENERALWKAEGGDRMKPGYYSWYNRLSQTEKDYIRDYNEWKGKLSSEEGELNDRMQKATDEILSERGMRSVPVVVPRKAEDASHIERFLNLFSGSRVFEGDLIHNKEVEQKEIGDKPLAAEVYGWTSQPVALNDGTIGYQVVAKVGTGDKAKKYTYFVEDVPAFRQMLAGNDSVSQSTNATEVGWMLHQIPTNRGTEPIIGGQNVWGDGAVIRRTGADTFAIEVPGQQPVIRKESDLVHELEARRRLFLQTGSIVPQQNASTAPVPDGSN